MDLAAVAEAAKAAGRLGIDTEFMSEGRYRALLCLVGVVVGDGWLARTLVQAAVNALTLPYFLTVWVLLYLDLRARKEPLDLNTLRADLQALEA